MVFSYALILIIWLQITMFLFRGAFELEKDDEDEEIDGLTLAFICVMMSAVATMMILIFGVLLSFLFAVAYDMDTGVLISFRTIFQIGVVVALIIVFIGKQIIDKRYDGYLPERPTRRPLFRGLTLLELIGLIASLIEIYNAIKIAPS